MLITSLRQHFPIFFEKTRQDWIYLDSAATSQKLQSVIDTTLQYYQTQAVNVHRSSHKLATKVTNEFEHARKSVQMFIGARHAAEIVWTKGATESINLVAQGLGQSYFKSGDEIVVSALEHHANIVPWQQLALRLGLALVVMPVDSNGVIKLEESLRLITNKTKLVACAHVSNAFGNINPIQAIIDQAKQVGALTLIDGTQAVSHLAVDVKELDCDFYVFSGHKMFGPTGLGVLYGKYDWLERLPPYQFGGEMINKVSFTHTTFQPPPLKFEAGTPNIAGVLALVKAVEFIQHNRQVIYNIEASLYAELMLALHNVPRIRLLGDDQQTICLQSFIIEGISQHDLGAMLNQRNIAIRVGHHCAMPLMHTLDLDGTLRVSLAPYNTQQDIERFVIALKESIAVLAEENVIVDVAKPSHLEGTVSDLPVAALIKQAKSWDQTYRQLMLAGKTLSRLAPEYKTTENEVAGCESQVWVQCSMANQKLSLVGDSPSKIVRGLLAVLFEAIEGKSAAQVIHFDLTLYLDGLNLGQHLSQSRGNGLAEVFKSITQYCQYHQGD